MMFAGLVLAACGGGGGNPNLGGSAPAPASVQFASATPVDQSIVIAGQGGNQRTETATLKFRVLDTANRPMAGQLVTFELLPDASSGVVLNTKSALTDQNGEVVTTVNSGTKATTFRVRASLANGSSTLSDSIVVTTGLPVQRAFSLSVGAPNVEGLNIDSTAQTRATTVGVLLADAFGNPVADGTPVVFQTNLGSIGSSSMGGCTLVNGGCQVDFRTQEPRTAVLNLPATPCNTGPGANDDIMRPGVATVCASTATGTGTLFARTVIFFSGSEAENVYLGGAKLNTTSNVLAAARPGEARDLVLQVNDRNDNPMPAGTTVQVNGLNNATSGGVAPDTIQHVFLKADASGRIDDKQGSTHLVKVIAATPSPCTAGIRASFNVVITSPSKVVTTYPFTMAITCP